tara:strand:+ start:751 stop:1074 length:324 start_codon:yes stop_codon:yes gene_type:complete
MNETTKKMLAELDAAIMECLWIPNEHLPEEFHDDREGGRTLKRLNRQVEESIIELDPREEKGEVRTAIIDSYAADVAAGREIEYEENNAKLYRNQQVFAEIMDVDLD